MDTHDVPTTKAVGKNRQWILDARPVGKLTGKEFRWHEASIPQPSNGQVLIRNLWLSVDPAQRIWMWRDSYIPKIPIGDMHPLLSGRYSSRVILTSRRAIPCEAASAGRTMLRPTVKPSAGCTRFHPACLPTSR